MDRALIGPAVLGLLSVVGLLLLQLPQTGILQATQGSALVNLLGLICAVFSIRAVFPDGHPALSALVLLMNGALILLGAIVALPMLSPRSPAATVPQLLVIGSVVAGIVTTRRVWHMHPEK